MPTDYSLQKIAEVTHGEAIGDKNKIIRGVESFETAEGDQITLAGGKKYLNRIDDTVPGAIFVPEGFEAPGKNLIRVSNPPRAFANVVDLYHPAIHPLPGIDHRASLGDEVHTGERVFIGAFASIGSRVTIGDDAIIQNGVFIGDDVVMGDNVLIHPNVTIMNGCRIGNRVTIHPGTIIGSDGYGFVPDGGSYHKVPQIGIVSKLTMMSRLAPAMPSIGRPSGKTWIQRGVKTDNLIHIAQQCGNR